MASNSSTLEPFSSPNPSDSSHHPWSYDVFLSFGGEDTHKNFTEHLYHALIDAGINTYMDDNQLRKGGNIAIELPKAIQESRISLIVFSRNYATSRWCLDQLVNIMECQSTVRQVVLPVFYDVSPSDVRKQTGSFGEAFAELEERFMAKADKVLGWKNALTKAGNLSGWDLSAENGYEANVVNKIVEEILNHMKDTYLKVSKHPVGIDSRLQYMNKLLRVGLNDVRIIGIYAMGGMGKTTVAKAIYNQFFNIFQDKSFLVVGEISEKSDGQVFLQEQLLYDILKKEIKVNNVDRGINLIKERLSNRRVLLIVDNINQLWQLDAVVGHRDWFGLGSRIIMTTRDEHLLENIEVDDKYRLDGLNYSESLELFSWHAFRKIHPREDYIELADEVIDYCKGLPLALEVLGSFLFGRSKLEWKTELMKFKRIPPNDIQEQLRISYDALEDNEKDIFLDIACFFIGVDKDYAVRILDGCDFFPEIGISVLVQRCLLEINEKNELTMHDLLRDMGREIVREESPKEIGNRSRLWFYDDVVDILMKHTGTEAVAGLILELLTSNVVHLSTKAVAKMQSLRLLQLKNVHHIEGNDDIFKGLKCLHWHAFPLKFIPKNFHVENLVDIDMQHSNLKQLWKESKFLGKLKFLDLSHSPCLTETPDFFQLPNLEKLILEDCTSLAKVHPSIGHLHRLGLMNLRGCKHLKNLPSSICMLKSLKIFNLSSCSNFEKLPEGLGEVEALIELLVDDTAVRQIPPSIVHLKNLKSLSLCGCKGSPSKSLASIFRSWVSPRRSLDSISLFLPTSLMGLNSLTELNLKDCNLSDEAIPKDLGSLSSLKDLDLRSNNFRSLPDSISNLPELRYLKLDHCTRLQSLPELPTSLWDLHARGCISLERLSNLSKFQCAPRLILNNCYKLVEIPGFRKSQRIRDVCMVGCYNLPNTFKDSLVQLCIASQVECESTLVFPGNEIPQWFSHQWTGLYSSFRMPDTLGCKILQGIALCTIFESNTNSKGSSTSYCEIMYGPKRTKISIHIWPSPTTTFSPISTQDHILVTYLRFHNAHPLYDGDQVEVEVIIKGELNLKKFGVRLLYDDAGSSTQSDSGGLILCNSASNQNAIFVGDDDQDVFEDQAASKGLKRDRHDDDGDDIEGGPIHGWSDEGPHLKRLRYQAGSS